MDNNGVITSDRFSLAGRRETPNEFETGLMRVWCIDIMFTMYIYLFLLSYGAGQRR